MIQDINYKANEIYNTINLYLSKNNKYNAKLKKRELNSFYPIICFENRSNVVNSSSLDNNTLDKIRSLSFEISILAVDNNKEQVSSIEICEYYENIIAYVMENVYKLKGGTDAKIYNINDEKATKFVMHYYCKWFVGKNMIY